MSLIDYRHLTMNLLLSIEVNKVIRLKVIQIFITT